VSEPQPSPGRPAVYFIQSGDDGPIKIGLTTKPVCGRLAALQTASPYPLALLAVLWPDDPMDERSIHAHFRPLRMMGEWFRPEPPLLDFIERVRRDGRSALRVVPRRRRRDCPSDQRRRRMSGRVGRPPAGTDPIQATRRFHCAEIRLADKATEAATAAICRVDASTVRRWVAWCLAPANDDPRADRCRALAGRRG
jgi:hypothetical protein